MFALFASSKSLKVALFSGVALVVAGLGGCNDNVKTENEALRNQITQVTAERDQNKQLLDASEARKAELQGQLDQAMREKATAQNPPMGDPAGGGGKGGTKSGGKTSGNDEVDKFDVAGDVLFAPGQAVLGAAGKKELDKIAATIKAKYARNAIRVEGYTDSDPVVKSSYKSNDALSKARAVAVQKYLISKGVSSARMTAVGRGSANPKSTKALSRRVEIHILGG